VGDVAQMAERKNPKIFLILFIFKKIIIFFIFLLKKKIIPNEAGNYF
jgi:hypothetical protein